MKQLFLVVPLLILVGCKPPSGSNSSGPGDTQMSLVEARKGFTTKLAKQHKSNEAVAEPPPQLFSKVQYESPAGKLAAYLTPDPKNGKKNPAIIWITGGDCNTIGDVWSISEPTNDQTARQYRKAGIVMMFPSLRGGNKNPGYQEHFLGEVDDVLAAAEALSNLDFVDPKRIYLGGHSTGGTLVLLVAECSDRFRGVFSFGPVDDIKGYGGQFTAGVNTANKKEVELRSPGYWLHSIQTPTFVFEGTSQGNVQALQAMAKNTTNPKAHFYPVKGGDHFNILAPLNTLIAQKILKDDGAETNITFTEDELTQAMKK